MAAVTFRRGSELDRNDVRICVWLLAVALGVRLSAILLTGFDGVYGQDAFAYHRYAGELREALWAGHPPPPFFWPLGYPLLVAMAMTIAGGGQLAGQAVSVVTGALLSPLLYLLAREAGGKARAGVLAGLLGATAAQPVISSVSVMSDAAGAAWITLSAWALTRYFRALRLRSLALAAFALAAAILTRWVYLLAVFPWASGVLLAWHAASVRRRRALSASVLAGAIGVTVVGAQFLSATGSSHAGDLLVVGWDPTNAIRASVTNSDGTFSYRWPIGVFYAMQAVHPRFVFPVLAPFLLLGFWGLRKGPPWLVALLAGWPLITLALLIGIAWESPRFFLAGFPPLAVLTGLGWERTLRERRGWRRVATATAGALGIAGSLAWASYDVHRFVAVKRYTLELARWADEQAPPGAKIVSLGLTDTLRHYTERDVVELYSLDASTIARLTQSGAPIYVLADPSNLKSQWRGKAPEANFELLGMQGSLVQTARRSSWVLFHLEPHSP